MSIFENAGEPFRRIRRQARQRRELAIQPSTMRAQSSLESEFNHDLFPIRLTVNSMRVMLAFSSFMASQDPRTVCDL